MFSWERSWPPKPADSVRITAFLLQHPFSWNSSKNTRASICDATDLDASVGCCGAGGAILPYSLDFAFRERLTKTAQSNVAQLVEHQAVNLTVTGSTPVKRTDGSPKGPTDAQASHMKANRRGRLFCQPLLIGLSRRTVKTSRRRCPNQ